MPAARHCIAGMLGEAKPLLQKPQAMMKATEAKFSIKEVAQRFRVHATTVYRLMEKGKLGFYQIGGRRIVGESHLEQYLAWAEHKAGSARERNSRSDVRNR